MTWPSEPELRDLVERFRARTLSHRDWTHQAHVSVGTWYVYERGPARALADLREAIRRLNDVHGTPNSDTRGYHETITRGYICLIADLLALHPVASGFDAVQTVMRSPVADRDALLRHFSRDRLMSTEARRGWIAPDREPLAAPEWPRPVTTARLRLRSPEPHDASAVAPLMTPGVSRWLATWPSGMTESEAAARIGASLDATATGDALHYVVTRREDEAIVGWIRIERSEPDGARGELGFWLAEAFHGKGYMTEAAAAACATAFKLLGLTAIEAGAQPLNTASHRVLQKLGMQPIGERAVYAALRNAFETCLYFELSAPATCRT